MPRRTYLCIVSSLLAHSIRPSTSLLIGVGNNSAFVRPAAVRPSQQQQQAMSTSRRSISCSSSQDKEYYRPDGVRITHNPYAPGMAEKYGLPGNTDQDGFDPYNDTVGPGIYSGSVKRNDQGEVVMGQQYQNHNHRPGPVYDGNGYSLISKAIQAGPDTVKRILADFPELVHEVSTGGARPLHTCGMSQRGQVCTQILIDAGADIHAVDTYGYTALHRMASNNLPIGGQALVEAGLDPNEAVPGADSTPIEIAKRSRAIQFLMKMQELGHYD
mmetsp:Transcript_13781/g.38069  ORF Transcript_13781/g.38069 Transcript_13781/m.38069 type:complete len:272 (+) Transcript_13781:88-903(+)